MTGVREGSTVSRLPLKRSDLSSLMQPASFCWATGIEDTFITASWPQTGRSLDEYELTQHYQYWYDDIGLIANLGVKTVRYGIPWYKINPEKGRWDWTWADDPLERLLELKIDPIVDLIHYGTPLWMNDAFLHPDYPEYAAEYASRCAERYKGRIRWYTPLNEPRVTAWYSGKLGWWPPYKRGWRGFIEVISAVCKGIIRTIQAYHSVDPEILTVHVDATDLYYTHDNSLSLEVAKRQEIVYLALDLISGRVTTDHYLYNWLRHNGISDNSLSWFQTNAIELDVIGMNLYPLFTWKHLARSSHGLRTRMPYGPSSIVSDIAMLYWKRYRCPLMITETATLGKRRKSWLIDSITEIKLLREQGIPVIGYTWWPMFSLVGWAYRQSTRPLYEYLLNLGLWDLDPEPSACLKRIPTELVSLYRSYVSTGHQSVGLLQPLDAV